MTNYKETLNLPETSYPMRADLSDREPEQLKRWDEVNIYQQMLQHREGAEPFILHDGPPYANGHIHHGHILNKTLKDIVIKYKNMSGFYTPFIPGWDCHGLPIEHNVEKALREEKVDIHTLDQNFVRKRCRAYADEFVAIQRDEFKRMMIFADWEHPYKTMNYPFEAATLRVLAKFFGKKLVYRALKPIHWDWASETALADAELEYKAFTTEHVYVKFELPEYPEEWKSYIGDRTLYCVIWTTTPWTLPSNLGIALGPKLDYSLVANGDEVYIIADGLRESFEEACKLSNTKTLHSFVGSELVGELGAPIRYHARHPFLDRDSALMPADHVTLEQGTGCVHTAPGHGAEDFALGLTYDLGVISPVTHQGKYDDSEDVARWKGMHVFTANKKIQAYLAEIGVLLNEVGDKVTIERYPHGWRSKKPLIFRSTMQWFVALDNTASEETINVRQEVLDAIERIGWVPSWGRDRIVGMVENRPDWCISRQRSWGVPVTVFLCECGEAILDEELTMHVADLFEQFGADVWFERSATELLPEGTTCPHCGATPDKFTKNQDILDVWFDSGTTWAAVVADIMGHDGPADLYLEGSDQHRGWFNSSLTCGIVARGTSPYRTCLTHGFVNDENGHKYSKSSKNYEPPEKMINALGAEILRFWVSAVDYRADITLSKEVLARICEAYRKVRNTIRYLLGNISDLEPSNLLPYEELEELDAWLLDRTGRALKTIAKAYDNYQFHTVYHTIVQFCTVDLSSVHMDISKDRVYCEARDGKRRRSAQTAYWYALRAILGAIAPILSFTAEEAWEYCPKEAGDPDSIFLTDFPKPERRWIDDALAEKWSQLLDIRTKVQKALEEKRVPRKEKKPGQIGSSQEAVVEIKASGETYELLHDYESFLAELFITSDATLQKVEGGAAGDDDFEVTIVASEEGKCPRCWNFWIKGDAEVCPRCAEVLGVAS